MNVLVLHDRYRSAQPSGENTVVEDEADLLAEAGCVVERLELASDDIAMWSFARRALLPLRVVWSSDGYRLTARAIERFGPDVVHVHNTFPLFSPAALWAAHRSGAAVVQTLHNFRPLCAAASFFRDGRICEECIGGRQVRALARGCYRGSRLATAPLVAKNSLHRSIGTWTHCVDAFIAPSEFVRRKYVAAGWPAERILVKHNTARDLSASRNGWHGSFTYLGRFGPEKGTDLLLAAWAEAFPDGGAALQLIGPDGDAAAPAAGVQRFGRVEHGRALQLLAGSRALVLPSRLYEAFPRAIVEAYSLGVPVIASRVGPLPELVEHDRTGLVVGIDGPEELACALRTLSESDAEAQRLGRGARRAFEQTYSPERTTARLLEIYAQVAR